MHCDMQLAAIKINTLPYISNSVGITVSVLGYENQETWSLPL